MQEAIERNRRRWARYRRAGRVRARCIVALYDAQDADAPDYRRIARLGALIGRCEETLAPLRAAREGREAGRKARMGA